MDSGVREAEQMQQTVVRAAIGGAVMLIRVSGPAYKFIQAAVNGQLGPSGEMSLKAMLQSGEELRVIPMVGTDNFKRFIAASKDYGIKYAVMRRTDKETQLEQYELMVFARDASKINRIIEKYDIAAGGQLQGSGKVINEEELSKDEIIKDLTANREIMSKMMQPRDKSAIVNPSIAPEEKDENLSGARLRSIHDVEEELASIHRQKNMPPKKRFSVQKEIELLQEKQSMTASDEKSLANAMINPSDASSIDKYAAEVISRAVKSVYSDLEKASREEGNAINGT
ncbi:MAG: PcfB family protein [Eubacterium sp.]|nr:PcfB family protein [Eubacterium sp.]